MFRKLAGGLKKGISELFKPDPVMVRNGTKHFDATKSLINVVDNTPFGNPIEEKRSVLYLDWIKRQAELFQVEKSPLRIPDRIFPTKITRFAYNKNTQAMQTKIDKYYKVSSDGTEYLRNSQPIDINDSNDLLHCLVFLRGNVVWIDFGFNIGCEFGGRHPAIILKNLGEALIVAPLTSGTLSTPKPAEVVIDTVFNLPRRDRYTNITRIAPISIYRVNLNSPMGSVRSARMREIFNAIKNEWKL